MEDFERLMQKAMYREFKISLIFMLLGVIAILASGAIWFAGAANFEQTFDGLILTAYIFSGLVIMFIGAKFIVDGYIHLKRLFFNEEDV